VSQGARTHINAARIISTLAPKWNPNHPPIQNPLHLTSRRKGQNEKAEKDRGPILFDPKITTEHIIDGIRIFTDPPK
jgi:hypothetical protein